MTKTTHPRLIALLAAALAAGTGFAATAHAAPVDAMTMGLRTGEVRTGDLNLASAAGRDELTRRIDAAAGRVCRLDAPTGSLIRDRAAERECASDVRRQVESRLALRATGERLGR